MFGFTFLEILKLVWYTSIITTSIQLLMMLFIYIRYLCGKQDIYDNLILKFFLPFSTDTKKIQIFEIIPIINFFIIIIGYPTLIIVCSILCIIEFVVKWSKKRRVISILKQL